MDEPAIQFVEGAYSDNETQKMIAQFRNKGYVVLPDVIKGETVAPFVKQLEEIMSFDGIKYFLPDDQPHYMHCAMAPKARQILPAALSHSQAKPKPCIDTTIVIIQTKDSVAYIPDWHKDREPDGMPGNEYHYPLDVFLAFYFEDMLTDDKGPTLIIPGSHRDVSLTPTKNADQVEPIYLRKEDCLLIDQRAWHRGSLRTVPGNRFLIVYGVYALPHFYGNTSHMPRSQLRAWIRAKNINDRIYLGGPYSPPDIEDLDLVRKELEEMGGYAYSSSRHY